MTVPYGATDRFAHRVREQALAIAGGHMTAPALLVVSAVTFSVSNATEGRVMLIQPEDATKWISQNYVYDGARRV